MNTAVPKKYKILLVGDNCNDIYTYGTVDRISPEAPVPVFIPGETVTKPGMAANVKLNLENLNCDVDFLSGKTGDKQRLIDQRSGQHLMRIDRDSVSMPLALSDLQTRSLNAYDAVLISDYNKGTVDYALIKHIRKNYNGAMFLDTKKPDLAQFNDIFVKINQTEFEKSTSTNNQLIVTLGSRGAQYQDTLFPAVPVDVVDVCGAGDTFLAALAVAYIETNSIQTAIEFAVQASSITVQHLGCYAPSRKEIQNGTT